MNCNYQKSALDTASIASQSVLANGLVNFTTNNILTGCSIKHTEGSNTANINCAGLYLVLVNIDLVPVAAGPITVQLLNNGVAVPGAKANITGAVSTSVNLSFNTLLKVLKSCPCMIDNTANLQVQVSAAATISNAKLVIVKQA